jgi:hypothetical protein
MGNLTKVRQLITNSPGKLQSFVSKGIYEWLAYKDPNISLDSDAFEEIAFMLGQIAAEKKQLELGVFGDPSFEVHIVTGSLMRSIRGETSLKREGKKQLSADIILYIDESAVRMETDAANARLQEPINTGERVSTYTVIERFMDANDDPEYNIGPTKSIQEILVQASGKLMALIRVNGSRIDKGNQLTTLFQILIEQLREAKEVNMRRYKISLSNREKHEKNAAQEKANKKAAKAAAKAAKKK